MKIRTGRACRVRLELVRQVGHAEGNGSQGYDFVVPLNPDGRIDATSWLDDPLRCWVRRFTGTSEKRGVLSRRRDGRWYFEYGDAPARDRAGFNRDRIVAGDLLGIVEADDRLRTYRIVSVEPLPVAATP